jgi:hypothetical protein
MRYIVYNLSITIYRIVALPGIDQKVPIEERSILRLKVGKFSSLIAIDGNILPYAREDANPCLINLVAVSLMRLRAAIGKAGRLPG